MGSLLGHLRTALRNAFRAPGFSLAVVLTLALGIGATTAIFSVVHAVLLKPLPFVEPQRLVSVWESIPDQGVTHNVVSSGNYMDWRDGNDVFESMAAYSGLYPVTMTGAGNPERLTAVTATASLFPTLGVQPLLGGAAQAGSADSTPGGEVLISYAFWRDRFGMDADVVGRTVRLDGRDTTVAGVMAQHFGFPGSAVQVWLPTTLDETEHAQRKGHKWKVVARLKPGVTMAQAAQNMRLVADGIREAHPKWMEGWDVNVFPLHGDMVGNYASHLTMGGGVSDTLWLVMAVVALTLLIACANVAGLMLARQTRHRHELAIRKALGAGRRRLVAGVLSECALLTSAGALIGVVLAHWGVRLIVATAPGDIPRLQDAAINAPVLGFSCALAALVIVLVGLIPALAASNGSPARALTFGARAGGGQGLGLRRALIVGEVALACVLTVAAGLLTHSLVRLLNEDSGIRMAGLQLVGVPLPRAGYGETGEQTRFHQQALERLQSLPGVSSAAGTAEPPVIGYQMTFSYVVEGRQVPGPNGFEPAKPVRAVTPGYFRTLGQPLLAGRAFDGRDRPDTAQVAVVNEAFAATYWPAGQAIGKRISLEGHDGPWLDVVGVAANTRHDGLDHPTLPAIYIPYAQRPWNWMSWMYYTIRSDVPGGVTAEAIRRAVWDVDPNVAVGEVRSVASVYADSNARMTFATWVLGGFGIVALVLSVMGIYGVLSYTVASRNAEFGVRMAVGADRPAILRLVLASGLRLALAGLAVGSVLAAFLVRALEGMLYRVGTLDPATFTLIPLLILATALLASLVPGLRAAATDPARSLRHE